ncbi:MAG: V-type ATPase subunit [Synergistaceae bacterium]|nr:V-type ATPase subunit [Synergistaceae bacterium]
MSYVYTVARIRGMEGRLLDAAFFSRLMDSPSIDEALKTLGETSYAQWLAQSEGGGFDEAIDAEMLATCLELARFVPDEGLLALYRMPYDFHNVKVLLKSLFKVRGGDGEGRRHDLLSPLGVIPIEVLTEAIETEEWGGLPYGLPDVIPQCWTLWDQTKSAQAVELLLDRQMYAAMLSLAEQLGTPDVVRWARHRIDAENLRTAVRLARMGYDPTRGLPFFHEGGTFRAADAARLLGEPQETWPKLLSHTGIAGALDALQEGQDMRTALTDVTKALDEHMVRVLERTRFSMDAPGAVLLYLMVKEAEARNMRIALVCVAGGLDREFARRLLSHVR